MFDQLKIFADQQSTNALVIEHCNKSTETCRPWARSRRAFWPFYD
jgi:hypothetical protein